MVSVGPGLVSFQVDLLNLSRSYMTCHEGMPLMECGVWEGGMQSDSSTGQ